MKYRPEIDGLRALAVLPVLFYHAGIPGFSGGFVGVDVFFVISGYLITSIILKEIEAGTFTLSHFWERRARRILPALFAVIIFCFIAGWFLLLPEDYKELGDSAIAQSIFASNIFFWRKVGYFAASAETKPLLHTWSLSVEEQFYILFPLILLLLSKLCSKKSLFRFTITSLLASLFLCIWIQHSEVASKVLDERFNVSALSFYLLPTRMWELLIGSVFAFSPALLNLNHRKSFGTVGFCGILIAIVFYNEQTIFPGYAALLPCLGAALIIWSNEKKVNISGRLLSLKPLTFIGKISYSLYLWHWPLLAFSQYWLDRELSVPEISAVLITTFFLSILSLKYIETPFRQRDGFIKNRKQVFKTAFGAGSFIFAFAFLLRTQSGIPERLPADIRSLSTYDTYWHILKGASATDLGDTKINTPTILLLGDSILVQTLTLFDDVLKKNHLHAKKFSIGGDPPIFGVKRRDIAPGYKKLMEQHINHTLNTNRITDVFFIAAWSGYISSNSTVQFEFGPPKVNSKEHAINVFKGYLDRTLKILKSKGVKRVWIFHQTPIQTGFSQRSLMLAAWKGTKPPRCNLEMYRKQNEMPDAVFKSFDSEGIKIIDPGPLFFKKNRMCPLIKIGKGSTIPLYRDAVHLTADGAQILRPLIEEIVEQIKALQQG